MKNHEFLLESVDFMLKNVDFITKIAHAGEDGLDAGEEFGEWEVLAGALPPVSDRPSILAPFLSIVPPFPPTSSHSALCFVTRGRRVW